jgi:hypothetical protein
LFGKDIAGTKAKTLKKYLVFGVATPTQDNIFSVDRPRDAIGRNGGKPVTK